MSKFKALLLLIPCAMFHALGMDIFVSDIPIMMRELNTDAQQIQYILAFFMFGTGIGQPFIGLWCDKYGRRKIIIASTALFIITSFLAARCDTIGMLTFFRFLQGLGACGTLVATFAVVNDTFHGRASYQMFSLIGCSLALTPMLAPMLGVGLMTAFGTWKACFYFLAVFSMAALAICLPFLPETRPDNTIIPTWKTFARNYWSVANNKIFLIYTLAATVGLAELYTYFAIGNILLIDKMGLTGFDFALVFAFNAVIFLLGNYYSTILQKTMGAYQIVTLGVMFLIAGSLSMLAMLQFSGSSAVGIIVPNGIMTFGVGLILGPATGASLHPFKRLAGTASGLFATIQYCGAGLIGFIASRFPIQTAASIAIPMLISACVALTVILLYRSALKMNEQEDAGTSTNPLSQTS